MNFKLKETLKCSAHYNIEAQPFPKPRISGKRKKKKSVSAQKNRATHLTMNSPAQGSPAALDLHSEQRYTTLHTQSISRAQMKGSAEPSVPRSRKALQKLNA